jgi:hypothetical protein
MEATVKKNLRYFCDYILCFRILCIIILFIAVFIAPAC